jgi:hypothetical protein
MVDTDRPQMTIWRIRFACRITKATNTLTIRNIYCFSTTKMVVQTRLSLPLYVQCLSCWHLSLYVNDLTDCTWNYERNMV